jgi:16S rRNA (cytosine967-C5)-methyltransferase
VYATCSLLPDENEAIVDGLLAEGGFTLLPVNELLAQQHIALDTGPMLKLSPALHGTDGFFAAVMVKAAAVNPAA